MLLISHLGKFQKAKHVDRTYLFFQKIHTIAEQYQLVLTFGNITII